MNHELLIFIVGLSASLIGSFISGTLSFISMSAFLAMGLPPHLGLSVLKFGATTHQMSGLLEYYRKNKIIWKYVLPITLIGIPFVILGTKIAISINEELFQRILQIMLIILIPITLWDKKLGTIKKEVSKKRERIGYITYAIIRFWASIFPFGHGVFIAYNYMHFWGMTLLEMKGTSRIPAIVANVISFLVFLSVGIINWKLSIFFGLGMLIGGFIGAKYAIKTGDKKLRYFLIAGILFLVIRSFVA